MLVSHAFTNWRLGRRQRPLAMGLAASALRFLRDQLNGRVPRNFRDHEKGLKRSQEGAVVLCAAHNIAESVLACPSSHPARQLLEKLAEETPWPGAMEAEAYERNSQLRSGLSLPSALAWGFSTW